MNQNPNELSQDYLGQAIKEHFEKVQRLESENLNLKIIAEMLNDEIGYLQQKNEVLQSECEGLAAAVSPADNQRLESENERLTDENNFLQEEVSRLVYTKSDENPFVDEYVSILKAQVLSLQQDNLNLRAENERLTSCNSSPRPTPYQPKMDAIRNHTDILMRVLEELELDVNELQSAISSCDW